MCPLLFDSGLFVAGFGGGQAPRADSSLGSGPEVDGIRNMRTTFGVAAALAVIHANQQPPSVVSYQLTATGSVNKRQAGSCASAIESKVPISRFVAWGIA